VNDSAASTRFLNGLTEVREAILGARIPAQLENEVREDLFGGIDFDSMMSFSQGKNYFPVWVDADLKKMAHAEITSDSGDFSCVIFFYLKVTNFFFVHTKVKGVPKSFSGKN
jgi:hypothetical protein